jgi:hypothetical protein
MRLFLGMILGAVLTAGAAFLHDTWSANPTTDGTSTVAVQSRPMVNWDVVNENWQTVSRRARDAWTALSQKVAS